MQRDYPQIKVCGLTQPDEAKACAELGADAIGLVFYPQSPRHVTVKQAAAITAALPAHATAVGVFVDAGIQMVTQTIDQCGLHVAQLHGSESPSFVADLKKATPAKIVKALFTEKTPGLNNAGAYDVAGFLVECGQGRLPGGNAADWDWSLAEPFGRDYPLILAGGLGPDNVFQAIGSSLPDAVDASSGLEANPGRKDIAKVERFIQAVRQAAAAYKNSERPIRSIF